MSLTDPQELPHGRKPAAVQDCKGQGTSFRLRKLVSDGDICALRLHESRASRAKIELVAQHFYHGSKRCDQSALNDALARIDTRLGLHEADEVVIVDEKLGVRLAVFIFALEAEREWRNMGAIAAKVRFMSIEEAY